MIDRSHAPASQISLARGLVGETRPFGVWGLDARNRWDAAVSKVSSHTGAWEQSMYVHLIRSRDMLC